MTYTSITQMTEAQRLDAEYFDALWLKLFELGRIELIVPPDEAMWRRDLGRSLRVTFEWLGDLAGRQVLELGCGPGDYTVMLARRGARVTAVDIAPSSLQVTCYRARLNGVEQAIQVHHLPAETLAFASASFDLVVGFGLLHHADPARLGPEVRRVLRPGGRALFREPLGMNPLLHLAREYLPYRQKHRSRNEHPLTYQDIERVGRHFSRTRLREFYLLSMISRAIGGETTFPRLWWLDEQLIRRLSPARRWCRYVLVEYAV